MKITIDIPNPPSEQRIIDIPIHFCGGQVVDAGGYGFEERKTGKWEVRLMRHFAHLIICSNCGADINITAEEHVEYYKRNFRYCPYCGAKMELG